MSSSDVMSLAESHLLSASYKSSPSRSPSKPRVSSSSSSSSSSSTSVHLDCFFHGRRVFFASKYSGGHSRARFCCCCFEWEEIWEWRLYFFCSPWSRNVETSVTLTDRQIDWDRERCESCSVTKQADACTDETSNVRSTPISSEKKELRSVEEEIFWQNLMPDYQPMPALASEHSAPLAAGLVRANPAIVITVESVASFSIDTF